MSPDTLARPWEELAQGGAVQNQYFALPLVGQTEAPSPLCLCRTRPSSSTPRCAPPCTASPRCDPPGQREEDDGSRDHQALSRARRRAAGGPGASGPRECPPGHPGDCPPPAQPATTITMNVHWERNTNAKCDCTILNLTWMGKVPEELPEDEGWKLNRHNYYQEGWLATGNVRGIVGVTFTSSHCKRGADAPLRTNYNLRGHHSQASGAAS
ncbi:hypothetical protein FOCC_FOCC006836 [Frankliniella occidentalis]|nr:hypothetical protein FOCC_FOCC006836 [Frankliniella occidentalis]